MLDVTISAPTQPVSDQMANDPRWLAVERIANSEGFRRSPRLREFLLYVAAQQLSGHLEEITEQNIGHRVYKRRETYNPTDDNIVRVSARQLRVKLWEYYELEGVSDSWMIEIPKGGYVPRFQKREPPVVTQPAPEHQQDRHSDHRHWLLTALIALGALAAGWLIPSPIYRVQQAKQNLAPNLITALFSNSTDPVQVVVSDPAFGLVQNILGHRVSIEEYATQGYLRLPPQFNGNPVAKMAWDRLVSRQLVNLGDVGATNRFRDVLAASGHASTILMRSAQNIRARDFRSGNFIIMGDSHTDPWAQLFDDDKLDFRFVTDQPNGDLAILNLHPKSDEPHLYQGGNGFGYARIALVPNLTKTGWVLLIAGTSMEATESAANFCLDTQSSRTLLATLGVKHGEKIPSFEALLKTYEKSGTGLKAELVMARTFKSEFQ